MCWLIFLLVYLLGIWGSWWLIVYYSGLIFLESDEEKVVSVFFRRALWWYMPGGFKRRTVFIKKIILSADRPIAMVIQPGFGDELVIGQTRLWSLRAVAEQDLYDECAADVLPSAAYFWLACILTPIFWPIALVFMIMKAIIVFVRSFRF